MTFNEMPGRGLTGLGSKEATLHLGVGAPWMKMAALGGLDW